MVAFGCTVGGGLYTSAQADEYFGGLEVAEAVAVTTLRDVRQPFRLSSQLLDRKSREESK
jgi:predicted transcriptional regulator